MYIRTTQGRTEFSTCETIRLIYNHDTLAIGQWVSNPSAELIAAEDWLEYIPPVIPPQPQDEPTEEEKVTALNKFLASDIVALDDASALEVIALFPSWTSVLDKDVTAGERYYDDEALWQVIQSHHTQANWRPKDTPALWKKVTVEEWPEWVRPIGVHDAYNEGDKVTFEEHHYISKVNGNIYSPSEYPINWEYVE